MASVVFKPVWLGTVMEEQHIWYPACGTDSVEPIIQTLQPFSIMVKN